MGTHRVGGIITMLFGCVSLYEAIRLYPERMSFYVGDHIFPGVIGLAMLVLGLLALFAKGEQFTVEFPDRRTLMQMAAVLGIMLGYWLLLFVVGYVISTLVASVLLFRVIGSYGYGKSLVYSVILTAAMYLFFVYWLTIPFPNGIFNF
jgi:putative tricarboxylic transport membrane protein